MLLDLPDQIIYDFAVGLAMCCACVVDSRRYATKQVCTIWRGLTPHDLPPSTTECSNGNCCSCSARRPVHVPYPYRVHTSQESKFRRSALADRSATPESGYSAAHFPLLAETCSRNVLKLLTVRTLSTNHVVSTQFVVRASPDSEVHVGR